MKCFGTTATEADLPVSAKSFGLGTWIKAAAWQVRSELAGAGLVGKDRKHGSALVRRRAWGAQVPDHQATARISQMETRVC